MNDLTRKRFLLYSELNSHNRNIANAQKRVLSWLDKVENPYIAFSTGKDSTCVLHLVREQAPETPAVYFDASCSFPESFTMLKQTKNTIVYPAIEPLLDTFKRFGGFDGGPELERETMRTTVWEPIKRLLKEFNFDGCAYGLRAEESYGRTMHAKVNGSVFQYRRDGVWGCQPIHDWSYNDVWAYIVSNDIDYCGVYDKMWDMPEDDQRLSYWAGETKRKSGRWAFLKRNYPELFNRFAAEFPEARNYI